LKRFTLSFKNKKLARALKIFFGNKTYIIFQFIFNWSFANWRFLRSFSRDVIILMTPNISMFLKVIWLIVDVVLDI
jgi:hypothetical protein